jgi:hypothetical protein
MKKHTKNDLRLTDNDEGEISVTLDGREVRGWSYSNDDQRRLKMLLAREFIEGWYGGFNAGLDRAEEMFLNAINKPAENLFPPDSVQ